jgi:hypothetical protein
MTQPIDNSKLLEERVRAHRRRVFQVNVRSFINSQGEKMPKVNTRETNAATLERWLMGY